jgi:hypothetical protein
MKKELKQAIVNCIFENERQFQITNYVKGEFKDYIYTSQGSFLIGGEEVAEFIENAIKLLINR